MNNTKVRILQLWPLLAVRDISRSIEFYRHSLGFDVVGHAELDGRLFWCRLERDGQSVMLQQGECSTEEPGGRGTGFYFVCDDADAMYSELVQRGLDLEPPQLAEYGMKQLFVPEPDGYSVCFESPTKDWAG